MNKPHRWRLLTEKIGVCNPHFSLCVFEMIGFMAGYLAYRGHEVRIYDSNTAALNNVNQRISEDARICKEDGIMTNCKFLVIFE